MTDFVKTLRRYIKSGVGVIAVRTRDPMETMGQVSAYCSATNRPLRLWDCARGWIKGDDAALGESTGEAASRDLLNVFAAIAGQDTQNGQMPENCVFGLMNPHLFVKPKEPHPMLVQMLSILAHTLPTRHRRMIMTIPTGYSFPPELQELIPIIDDAPPTVAALSDAAEIIFASYRQESSRLVPVVKAEDLKKIGQAGVGMILPEFEASLSRVLGTFVDAQETVNMEKARAAVLREKAEVVRRNRSLEVLTPVTPEQVGGLDNLKEWVRERASAMDPAAWEQGVDKPKGVALVGPPGTGKSLCGKMAGSVLGVATIRFDIASVFQGLVGASEENMREALFLLESLAPAVVLIDELDKAISLNSGNDGGTSQKVLGTLLTFMQETKAPIFWMMTLNRTENIPAEILRAGRLDQIFGVGVPSLTERMAILRYHLKARKVDPDGVQDLDDIARRTDRFVGAEIEAVVSGARLAAFNAKEPLTHAHLAAEVDKTRPLSKRMAAQFTAMETWCKENALPANRDDSLPTIPTGQVVDTGEVVTTRARPRRRLMN